MTVSLRVTTTVTLCLLRKVFELTLGLTQTVVRRFRHK